MSNWSLTAPTFSILISIGVVLLSGWLGWGIWNRNGRRRNIAILEVLRTIAVTLLAFTLLEPEFIRRIIRTEQPQISILNDHSESMLTRDIVSTNEIISRKKWLDNQNKREFWKELEDNSDVLVDINSFASPTNSALTNNLTNSEEIGTDLNSILSAEIDQKKNLKAVLLLSDGDWNLGSSPISAATRYRDKEIPIYSIVTGQDQPIADLSMEDISAPAYGLFGEQISIPYTIQSHLPRDVSTEIRLMNGKEILASKKISLPAKNRFRDSIMWYPSEIGEFDLRLEFPVEQDEELKDNNSENKKDIQLGIIKIINSLESYNQSHVFGLLNIIYLKAPFLKKDVMRQGVFSYSQIYEILKLENLNIEKNLSEEIMEILIKGGTTYSFMESKRSAYRRGIPVFGKIYEYQFESSLIRDKYFNK